MSLADDASPRLGPVPQRPEDGSEEPEPGLPAGLPLGPDSLTWRWFGDVRMLLLGPRAAVLQNMLPALGQGVQDHSVWFAETLARLQRSIPPIYATVYGDDPAASGREVRDFHRTIKGRMPDGSPYSALNPDTYYWAHACFVEHLITATDTFIRRLSRAEKEQIFAESVTWFGRYGVSSRGTPRTYAEFEAYFEDALEQRLVAHRTATYGVGYATKGWPRPRAVPRPVWWLVRRPVNAVSSSLTIGGLPPRAREILGLPWDAQRERRYRRFARLCRASAGLVDRLPVRHRMHPIPVRAFRREGRPA
jgi:uncharacterized protein (DUF2236 family)